MRFYTLLRLLGEAQWSGAPAAWSAVFPGPALLDQQRSRVVWEVQSGVLKTTYRNRCACSSSVEGSGMYKDLLRGNITQ